MRRDKEFCTENPMVKSASRRSLWTNEQWKDPRLHTHPLLHQTTHQSCNELSFFGPRINCGGSSKEPGGGALRRVEAAN
jgi:hypothetical protein